MSAVVGCMFVFLLHLALAESTTLSAVRKGPWLYTIVKGSGDDHAPEVPVTANFTNDINETGWAYLEVHSARGASSDEELAYLAGVLEGRLTGELIWMSWANTMQGYCEAQPKLCGRLEAFLANNTAYMEEQILEQKESQYWHQVSLFLWQLSGLRDGYAATGMPELDPFSFLLLQVSGDLDALESVLGGGGGSKGDNSGTRMGRMLGSGSCSALVKVLAGNSDLLVSHDTWSEYQTMLRIFKLYDLKFSTDSSAGAEVIPGAQQSFSSYPGVLMSGDDFYMISSGLVTMETTIGNNNKELWKYVSAYSVLEGIRSVVANRLATSGEEWSHIFSQHNSGTYNNEWMVVDYKLFQEGGKELSDNLLWVLEQIPGLIVAGDQTQFLRNQSYWPSYNIPYYPEVFKKSGFAEMVEQYGDAFSYQQCPRAKIFARNHSDVSDLSSMIKLMRYNDFKHDPLSQCNCTPPYSAENAISARSDLNPANGTYPIPFLGHRCHGGTDNKVTSYKMFQSLSCVATSGPTFNQQPPFQWSTSDFKPRPLGHPDKWQFEPQTIRWNKIN